jgi:hypothetical protein
VFGHVYAYLRTKEAEDARVIRCGNVLELWRLNMGLFSLISKLLKEKTPKLETKNLGILTKEPSSTVFSNQEGKFDICQVFMIQYS